MKSEGGYFGGLGRLQEATIHANEARESRFLQIQSTRQQWKVRRLTRGQFKEFDEGPRLVHEQILVEEAV